jgi:hypothetical protein
MGQLVQPVLPAGTLSLRTQPVLAAATVVLRPWGDPDVPDVVTAYADPDIQRWRCRSLDADEAASLICDRNRFRVRGDAARLGPARRRLARHAPA